MAKASRTKAAGGADRGLKVTSRPATFRRAGYNFSSEARVIPLDQLTEEQYDQITTETMLVAQEVDIEPEQQAETK